MRYTLKTCRVFYNFDAPFSQLDALYARTKFETIVFGVRSSADHYMALTVYTTSPKIPAFFDLVIKKPVTDLATSLEAFCLSGVDGESIQHYLDNTDTYEHPPGVIEKLVKHEGQLRGEVVLLINNKLCTSLAMLSIQQITESPSRSNHKWCSKQDDIQKLR